MTAARLIDAIPTKSVEERRLMRENARRAIHQGGPRAAEAKGMLEALDAFKADALDPAAHDLIGRDAATIIVEAFQRMPMSETERRLVQVLLNHPEASSEQLSQHMGWTEHAWHLHFGTMCSKREHLLWPAPFEPSIGRRFHGGILTRFDATTRGYNLKPEAVEAFARLGLRPRGAP